MDLVNALIASFEQYLGMKLFERRSGRLYPVHEAKYLFEECSELLRRVETIDQNMRRITTLESGDFKVASMPGPSVFFIPNMIARHGLDHADITCTMISRSSEAVYQLIAAQQYDLGIADFDEDAPAETPLINRQVFRFNCVCAIPAEDDLSGKSTVSARDLDERKIGILYPDEPVHRRIERAFYESGSRWNPRFMTQNFISLLTFVENGIACAIVDPVTAESYHLYRGGETGIVFRPFEPAVKSDIAVLAPAHRPSSMIGRHFREIVTGELDRIAAEY